MKKRGEEMFYIIFGLPIAAIFAVLQVLLCEKSKKKAVRLIPLFITLGIIASLGILLFDPVSGFIARYIDWGVFVLVVYLALGAVGSAVGTAAGWIIYLIKNKNR